MGAVAMNKARFTLEQINALGREDFARLAGPVFEHSPWIAGTAWADRPFASLDALHRALCDAVDRAGEEKQLHLIRAHPDLVGRAAPAGTLTPASAREQADAGLDRLGREDIAAFAEFNRAYREKFDFPFIICARLNKKEAILAGFRARLTHSRETEIRAALAEIFQIARLRLEDLIVPL